MFSLCSLRTALDKLFQAIVPSTSFWGWLKNCSFFSLFVYLFTLPFLFSSKLTYVYTTHSEKLMSFLVFISLKLFTKLLFNIPFAISAHPAQVSWIRKAVSGVLFKGSLPQPLNPPCFMVQIFRIWGIK